MISVIIPAYNAAATLPACLQALQRQTQPPDEIIVVDDGSQDETLRLAENFPVRTLRQEHRGPAAARNLGIASARGEIILLTDADCAPTETWVAEMLRPLADESVAGVKGAYLTRQPEAIARLAQIEFEERYDLLEKSPAIDFIDTYSAAFRASILKAVSGFDPAFPLAVSEDAELSYRLAESGRRLVFNRRAQVYHQHPRSWAAYLRRKVKFSYWRMVVYRLHPGKALRDSYTPQLLKLQVALAGLTLAFTLLAFFSTLFFLPALACLSGLCLTALPFVRRVSRRDPALTALALPFILARSFAFSLGVAAGLAGMFFFRPALARPK
ncbi:MAG: hypothetical protein OHK0031_05200 [Anaerolineales bacterium]